MGFGKYIKTAFLNRWNLLVLAAAAGFSILADVPMDVWVPLLAAGETAYLGMLGTHPKFQKYVDAQEAKEDRAASSVSADESLRRVLASLPPESLERFHALRKRCLELRHIASALKDTADAREPGPLEDLQTGGLDRLLWIYLRLLYTQYMVSRFLRSTDPRRIEQEIKVLQNQLDRLGAADQGPAAQRKKTLSDNLQTCRDRLVNYQKAKDSYELMELELGRLENKINALAELSVNRQEPEFVSGQIDQVANSMVDAEKTLHDLRFATGLESVEESVPVLLDRQKVTQ